MVAVALVFTPLAPLVPLAAAIIFWISSFVYKYQLMFVFVTKVESGGVSRLVYTSVHLTHIRASACGTLSSTDCSGAWSSCSCSWFLVSIFLLLL